MKDSELDTVYSNGGRGSSSNCGGTQYAYNQAYSPPNRHNQHYGTNTEGLYPRGPIGNRVNPALTRNKHFNMSMQMSPHNYSPSFYGQESVHNAHPWSPASSDFSTTVITPSLQPSRMALELQGVAEPRRPRSENNYMGQPSADKVYQLPDGLNCALFVENIPTNALYWEIFDRIHTGAVASLYIKPADEQVSNFAQFSVCSDQLASPTSISPVSEI
jgi:hypothetical protein